MNSQKWLVSGDEDQLSITDGRNTIAEIVPVYPADEQRDRANAALIAAAPDMLAALLYLRDCIENNKPVAMSSVNAAIAKARGK